jgi:hypothetical protein
MKDAYEVLYSKEADLTRVRQEIESLKIVAPMLSEEDLTFFQANAGPETESKKGVEKVVSEVAELTATGTDPASERTGIWDSFRRRR